MQITEGTPSHKSKPPYKIAIAGAGTVGQATINMLLSSPRVKESLRGYNIEVVRVLVNDTSKERPDLQIDSSKLTDSTHRLMHSGAHMLVEVMGGVDDAKELVYRAIDMGIDVVTANKALIADDIGGLREKLSRSNSNFGMEAAVGGGIPIISALSRSYSADQISQITGILNGTTNFILTKMESEGISYEEGLQQANDLGYAEADKPGELNPDLDGPDSRSKLAILSNLAFGVDIDEETFFMQGIRDISGVDFKYASDLGANIKFVGVAKKEGDTVSYYVSPSIVFNNSEIAQTNGVNNIVSVESENLGVCPYSGRGAGGEATANSVVADIINIIKGGNTELRNNNPNVVLESNFETPFYIRCTIKDTPGVTGKFTTTLGNSGINIDQVLQTERDSDGNAVFVCTTDTTDLETMQGAISILNNADYMKEKALILPILK